MRAITVAFVLVLSTVAQADPPSPMPEPAKAAVAPLPGGVNSAGLKTTLEGLGYDIVSEVQLGVGKGYYVKLQAGSYQVHTLVSTSSNLKVVWVQSTLAGAGFEKASPEVMLKMLDMNKKMSPALFTRSRKVVYLTNFRVNSSFNAKELKSLLDETAGRIAETEALWNPAKWKKAEPVVVKAK